MSEVPASDADVAATVDNVARDRAAMALANTPDAHELGRRAAAPREIAWHGWKSALLIDALTGDSSQTSGSWTSRPRPPEVRRAGWPGPSAI